MGTARPGERTPSPLVGEDRLGRSPSEEGGRLGRPPASEAGGFDGAPSSDATAAYAQRPPSPLGLAPESVLPRKGGEGARCLRQGRWLLIAGGALAMACLAAAIAL